MLSSTNLLYLFVTILYFFVLLCCYNNTLVRRKIITITDWILMSILSAIILLNNQYSDFNFRMPCTIIIIIFFFYVIFREKWFQCIYKGLFISLISIITTFILSILAYWIAPNIDLLYCNYIWQTVLNIIISYALYLLFKTRLILWIYHKISSILNNNIKVIWIVGLGLIIMGYNYYIFASNYKNLINYFIGLLLIILFLILAYHYFKSNYNNQIITLKSKYLESDLELYKNALINYKELKHNIINDFLFIKSLCDLETQNIINKKMQKYYNESKLTHDIETIPQGFQGLIYIKTKKAQSYNINVLISSSNEFDYKKMGCKKYIDLCEIIGIVLDNSIEAARKAPDKNIIINILESKAYLSIEITNTFINDIDLNKIGTQFYTTKEEGSGLGLNYIKKLNKNIQINREIFQDLFKTIISTKIKDKITK